MEKPFVFFSLEDNRFRFQKSNMVEMGHLGLFLTDDVGCYNIWYKEWTLDLQHKYTGGNYSWLEKEDCYIFIGCEFDESEPPLKIHRNELVKILDAWEQFCKTRPKEIIITKEDDDTFTIEAKN